MDIYIYIYIYIRRKQITEFRVYKIIDHMIIPFDRDHKSTILQESNCGLWMVTVKIIEDSNYRFSPFVHNHYCKSLIEFQCI